jgi:hypothetical protein
VIVTVSGNPEIRCVVTDIDGTLTSYNRRISVEAISTLRKIQDAGVAIILATGNVLPIAYGLFKMIGINGAIVAENGGILYYNQKVEYLNSPQIPLQAFEFLSKQVDVKRLFTDQWRETEVALEPTVDADTVRRVLSGYDVNVESSGFAVHIQSRNYTKFKAVQKASSAMGFSVQQLAAFGDGENDIEMLSGCGQGIAVGNAPERVRKAASHVTVASHGEGFIEGIRWLGIIN